MKKNFYVIAVLILTISLTACSNSFNKASSNHDTKPSTVTKKRSKISNTKMNFEQIKNGNYRSLTGNWRLISSTNGHRDDMTEAQSALKITSDSLSDGWSTLTKVGLRDNNGAVNAIEYKVDNGSLSADLKNQNVSINYSITFYPAETTSKYLDKNDKKNNSKNTIVFWSSNMNSTQVYVEDKAIEMKDIPKKEIVKKIDFEQIKSDNYSSLVGSWTNSSTGSVIKVTNEMVNKPANVNVYFDKGVKITETGIAGNTPTIIAKGEMTENGTMMGNIGRFVQEPSAISPLLIVPKGVKAGPDDDSDSSRDRLIVGGGQGGYAAEAYYRN